MESYGIMCVINMMKTNVIIILNCLFTFYDKNDWKEWIVKKLTSVS